MEEKQKVIPTTEQRRLQAERVKALYRQGMSMDAICEKLRMSKRDVFFAINRYKKKTKP